MLMVTFSSQEIQVAAMEVAQVVQSNHRHLHRFECMMIIDQHSGHQELVAFQDEGKVLRF